MGSLLTSNVAEVTVVVCSPKKVILNGKETSLTAATKEALDLSYSVAPGPYWHFEGRTISEIYEATYATED